MIGKFIQFIINLFSKEKSMKTFDEYMVDNMGKKVGNGQCVA